MLQQNFSVHMNVLSKYTLNGTSAKYSAIHIGSRWNSKCFKIQQLSLTFDINQCQPYSKININIRINCT